jgi:hypothetical protein
MYPRRHNGEHSSMKMDRLSPVKRAKQYLVDDAKELVLVHTDVVFVWNQWPYRYIVLEFAWRDWGKAWNISVALWPNQESNRAPLKYRSGELLLHYHVRIFLLISDDEGKESPKCQIFVVHLDCWWSEKTLLNSDNHNTAEQRWMLL